MNHKIDDIALHGALSANLVGFCRLLRAQRSGVAMGEEQDALRALTAIDLSDPEDFRLSLRTILAKTPAEQKLFDALFDVYWSIWDRAGELGQPQPEPSTSEKTNANRPGKSGLTSVRDWLKQGEPTEEEREAAGYSPIEVHTKRDFKNFNAEELEEIGRLLQAIARALATRFSRRYRPARTPGRLDLRRTLRASLRRGGELLDLSYCRRTRQKPKLVLLCDVSKSMDLYSRFLIQFMYAFQNAYRRIETFVFCDLATPRRAPAEGQRPERGVGRDCRTGAGLVGRYAHRHFAGDLPQRTRRPRRSPDRAADRQRWLGHRRH